MFSLPVNDFRVFHEDLVTREKRLTYRGKSIQEFIKNLLQEERQRIKEVENNYQELIMSVGNKYEGETRHQTALKYIKRVEQNDSNQVAKENALINNKQ